MTHGALKLTLVVALVAAVAGCSRLPSVPIPFRGADGGTGKVEFDGQRFRTRAGATTADRRGFSVAVARAPRSLAGALEAGRHRGIAYCLNGFGGSDIDWSVGPDRAPEEVALSGDVLVLAGTCTTR